MKPTTDEVLAWAREAGFLTLGSSYNMVAAAFTHAYAAGAAAMKERCVKACDGVDVIGADECVVAIRALGDDDE